MSKLSLGVQKVADSMDGPRSLVAIGEATRMLSEARTLEDVRQIRDLAEAARVYARAHNLGIEAMNYAAEIKARAERKGGILLSEPGLRDPGGRGPRVESNPATQLPKLADLGISKDQSSDWQAIASLPEPEFEAALAEAQSNGHVITSSGLVDKARGKLAGMMTSDSGEWYTPPEVVAAVVAAMGAIDLDPCADPALGIPAGKHYVQDDDGLSQAWRGRVYMNPPYGREIGDWTEKLVTEFEYRNVAQAIALVPGRIDTAWYRGLTERSSATVCHVAGRLRFSEADPAPFPSVAVHLGDDPTAFVAAFRSLGRSWRVLPE